MTSKDITKGILRAIAYTLGVSLLLLFIFKIQAIILYIIIAAVISLIGLPIVTFLKKYYFLLMIARNQYPYLINN